ncbi:MAG: DEAD/DEAH box helicase [SAR324 cluster bacterium]|nr:DEAD/DEAH box helicase [SAR324 cluster bacterium]
MRLFTKKQSNLIEKKYSSEGIAFQYSGETPPQFPLSKNDPSVLFQLIAEGNKWAALESLWEEDLLNPVEKGRWIVPYRLYESFADDELSYVCEPLDLPLPEAYPMSLTTRTNIGDKSFRIAAEIEHPELGRLNDKEHPRMGRVFYLHEDVIVPVTGPQAAVFDIARGEDVNWDDLEERMVYLAQVKKAGIEANSRQDKYLESEDYQFESELKLDVIENSPEEISIFPVIENAEQYGIINGDKLLDGEPPRVITKKSSKVSERKRLVIDKSARETISKLPEKGKITGSDVPKFLTNPEQFIPEGFDLSLFSERVKGFKTRVYNSRPYIHVRKTSGGWFEGIPEIKLEDWSPGGIGDQTDDNAAGKNIDGISEETKKELIKRAREKGEEYVQIGKDWVIVEPDIHDRFDNVIKDFEYQEDGSLKIPAGSVLDIHENVNILEFIDPRFLQKEESLVPDDLPGVSTPALLNCTLHPYQKTGYQWLTRLSNNSIGGLLADEMGLGKTVQVIAHFLKMKETGISNNLVVMPKSLMENWTREITKFSDGTFSVYQFDGPNRVFNPELFKTVDVVLTTYDTLRRDQVKLATINWHTLVCDEAQYAKNPTTQRTTALKALKAKNRIALSGTPVENGLIEFWCIMDFVQPGLLGSWKEFRINYERPIVDGAEEKREEHVQNLQKELKGYYLRRLKSEVLQDLPVKRVDRRETTFGAEQLKIYQEIAHRGKHGGKGAALGAIQQLRIISAHPLGTNESFTTAVNYKSLDCPKLDETLKIVSEIKEKDEKVIIFTDYKKIQRILQEAIMDRFNIRVDIINGEINHNRQQIIDIFSEKKGFNAMVLGHVAAGVGLNITAANHVIHYTRPWNPAKENQATDRVHRIGQTKDVTVYYPIITDNSFTTFEEKLDELLKSKEDLARDVLRPSAESKVKIEEMLDCLDV